jgi:hypothetical protein
MKGHGTFLFILALALSGCQQLWEQPSKHPYDAPQLQPTSGTVAVDAAAPLLEITTTTSTAATSPTLLIQNLKSKIQNPLSSTSETISAGRLAYRRYCWQCHGPKLDGDATVGPSLPGVQLSLLTSSVVALSDGEIFWVISKGSTRKAVSSSAISTQPSAIGNQPSAVSDAKTAAGISQSAIRDPESKIQSPKSKIQNPEAAVSPPLEGTMTPIERWQAIVYMRAVQRGAEIVSMRKP